MKFKQALIFTFHPGQTKNYFDEINNYNNYNYILFLTIMIKAQYLQYFMISSTRYLKHPYNLTLIVYLYLYTDILTFENIGQIYPHSFMLVTFSLELFRTMNNVSFHNRRRYKTI